MIFMWQLEIFTVMIISNERSNCQRTMELQTSTGSGVSSIALEVEALERQVQLNSECFVLFIAQALSLLLQFFVCALHTTPRSGSAENDIADLIFEHLPLTEKKYPDEPVVIAKNLTLKYLFG